jgi:hypothetical protein
VQEKDSNHKHYWLQLRKVESSCNVMAHGDAWEGKLRGNWKMEWVASTLHTTSEHGVPSITTADAHTSAASSRLNWRPADLNGLVRFAERQNLVSARLPSHFKCSLTQWATKKVLQRWSEYYDKHFEMQDGTDNDSGEVRRMCVRSAEPYVEPSDDVDIKQ